MAGLAAAALHLGAWWALQGRAQPLERDMPLPELPALQVRLLPPSVIAGEDPLALPLPEAPLGPASLLEWQQMADLRQAPQETLSITQGTEERTLLPDRPALARTSPDLSVVEGVASTGRLIVLRLHISASGDVERVEVVSCDPADEPFARRLAVALQATPHIPARRDGQDVASVKEIRVGLSVP
ncbi:MAG: hypothetical protein CFE46_12980 [Burkholderiales bacterium PBB6]|nr:MAG: hypothetical protein CFE46_12980 [Burkholderiales bacterium PBB6]